MDNRQYTSTLFSLRFVLILSIINGISCFFGYLMLGINLDTITQTYNDNIELFPEYVRASTEMMLRLPRMFDILSGLLFGMSFIGCLMMWKIRRTGFHLYTIAQLLIIIVTLLFVGKEFANVGSLMMTALLVLFYWISIRNLQIYQVAQATSQSSEEDTTNNDNNPTIMENNQNQAPTAENADSENSNSKLNDQPDNKE